MEKLKSKISPRPVYLSLSIDTTCHLQVRGRMLSTTTAIIHWDEPEEPNGQVVGYRVYFTTDNSLPVNQVCNCMHFLLIINGCLKHERAYFTCAYSD